MTQYICLDVGLPTVPCIPAMVGNAEGDARRDKALGGLLGRHRSVSGGVMWHKND